MLLMLLACWSVGESEDYFATVPFTTPYAETQTGVVETVRTSLECPDGQNARFYVVHDQAANPDAPVAVVLHSSAFDYVITPDASEPLGGQHFAGVSGYSRLERGWGIQKAWETMGMFAQVETGEQNFGTLPSALLDAGVVAIYPINCWGDLWHNETGKFPNDLASEYIERNGGAFAWWMVRFVTDPEFAQSQGFYTQATFDADNLTLFGLGDGARGVVELAKRQPEGLQGIMVDSLIDDLSQWQEEVPGVGDGLERIYYETDGGDIDWLNWSLKRRLNSTNELNGVRIGFVYSDIDTRVPAGNLNGTLNNLRGSDCVVNTSVAAHVHTNSDLALAQDMVDYVVFDEDVERCE